MKITIKTQMLLIGMLAMTALSAQARSWRINNDVTKNADFTDINAAMNSEDVIAGDTLYLDPGTNLTSEQNVTKQVTIIGTGYSSTAPYSNAVISGHLDLRAAYIKVLGVVVTNTTWIRANYILLERCRFYDEVRGVETCQYATIRQCYITKNGSTAIYGHGKNEQASISWTIENCIIISTGYRASCVGSLYCATIKNNLMLDNYSWNLLAQLGLATVNNNIIVNTSNGTQAIESSSCDGAFHNNIISQDFESATNYNMPEGTKTTDGIFTGDYESYELVENSPAKNYSLDGSDCGIFGGAYPYVKGGLPQGHPYFTKTAIQSRAENDKVKVSLNIKMQND